MNVLLGMKFSIEDNKINVLMKREDIIEGKMANLLVLIEVLYKSCKNVLPLAFRRYYCHRILLVKYINNLIIYDYKICQT